MKTCAACKSPAKCKAANGGKGACLAKAVNKKAGGGLKMVEKDGKKVPFFAADGKGKMMAGGKVKGYKSGCSVKSKGYKSGGKVRGCGLARGGRPCKMVKMKGA